MPKKIETIGQEQCWAKFTLAEESNLGEGVFRGTASVFGSTVQTWMPTIIEHGAFAKTLQENGQRIKLLYQHDINEPIGRPTSLIESEKGLEIEGKISQTTRGKDTLILMRDGVLDELSIGFDPIKWEMEDQGDGAFVRHVKELRLWEISPVTFAADPLAKIQSVHSLQQALAIADIPLESFAAFEIQTLIFPKKFWDSADACKNWLKDHDFKAPAVDETEESYRFRQRDPGDFDRLRTICINPSRDTEMDDCKVKAVGGPLKNASALIRPTLTDLAAVLLEQHEGKVLSGKNKKLLQDAVAALQALIAAAEPPPQNEDQALTANAEHRLREIEVALANLQLPTSEVFNDQRTEGKSGSCA